MSDKATLLRAADRAFEELREAIDGLSDEDMRRVWLGTWGVREILIHISGWHDEMATALGRLAKGDAPYPTGTYDDFDAWNARFVDRKAGVKTADVVADLEASHRTLLAAGAALPEALFVPDGAARGPFDGAGAGHYREHTEQIRRWRQG
ncbi:MAG TPA: ClbS/DfsB family four-helix bundle protein [Candidatus Limnocylindria bacterium]|nr:ClbS/DfsB family four-helix bundle protein [Candidatus Limnocylindria bacterium]